VREIPGSRHPRLRLNRIVLFALFCVVVGSHDADAAYGLWVATSFGAYMAPTAGFVGPDDGVDLVFHFHGARVAEREWRSAGLAAVVVDAELGGTSTPFHDAFESPERFGKMQDEVILALRARTKNPALHVRRVALVSWSAGYAAVARILAEPRYLQKIDAVLLLDSLHAPYVDPIPPGASEHGVTFRHLVLTTPRQSRGRAVLVDRHALAPFIDFGRLAAQGDKLMVLTHSDILPPDYASTTETAFTLTVAIDARLEPREGRAERGMWRSDASDSRGYHMRGYWGATPEAHVEHLHLVGDVVREFLAPRWATRRCGTELTPRTGTPCSDRAAPSGPAAGPS